MKRLRQQLDSEDPTTARAALLLNAVGPLPESRLRMRRVRHALDRTTRTRRSAWLRPAVLLGVLLGGVATAGATWGVVSAVRLVSEPDPSLVAPRVVPPQPAKPPMRGAVRRGISNPRPVEPDPRQSRGIDAKGEPLSPPAQSSGEASRGASHSHAVVRKPAQSGQAQVKSRVEAPLSDSVLVHRAVKALRSGGDAEQASELLERYRSRNPDGVLAEEALALSIEAAVAKGDPRARQLARQYLLTYPKGRFAAAARQAAR